MWETKESKSCTIRLPFESPSALIRSTVSDSTWASRPWAQGRMARRHVSWPKGSGPKGLSFDLEALDRQVKRSGISNLWNGIVWLAHTFGLNIKTTIRQGFCLMVYWGHLYYPLYNIRLYSAYSFLEQPGANSFCQNRKNKQSLGYGSKNLNRSPS